MSKHNKLQTSQTTNYDSEISENSNSSNHVSQSQNSLEMYFPKKKKGRFNDKQKLSQEKSLVNLYQENNLIRSYSKKSNETIDSQEIDLSLIPFTQFESMISKNLCKTYNILSDEVKYKSNNAYYVHKIFKNSKIYDKKHLQNENCLSSYLKKYSCSLISPAAASDLKSFKRLPIKTPPSENFLIQTSKLGSAESSSSSAITPTLNQLKNVKMISREDVMKRKVLNMQQSKILHQSNLINSNRSPENVSPNSIWYVDNRNAIFPKVISASYKQKNTDDQVYIDNTIVNENANNENINLDAVDWLEKIDSSHDVQENQSFNHIQNILNSKKIENMSQIFPQNFPQNKPQNLCQSEISFQKHLQFQSLGAMPQNTNQGVLPKNANQGAMPQNINPVVTQNIHPTISGCVIAQSQNVNGDLFMNPNSVQHYTCQMMQNNLNNQVPYVIQQTKENSNNFPIINYNSNPVNMSNISGLYNNQQIFLESVQNNNSSSLNLNQQKFIVPNHSGAISNQYFSTVPNHGTISNQTHCAFPNQVSSNIISNQVSVLPHELPVSNLRNEKDKFDSFNDDSRCNSNQLCDDALKLF